jgi:hypothetical protein
VLTNTIPNPMGASIYGGVSRKAPNFILRSKAPIGLQGAIKAMCQALLFFAKTLVIFNI